MNFSELKKLLEKSFVIDNRRLPLGEAVGAFLKESIETRMAIGYLFIEGFQAIAGSFGHLQNLQILMGHKTDRETKAILSLLHKKPFGFLKKILSLFKQKGERPLEDEIRGLLKQLSDLDLQSLYDLIESEKAKFKIYHLKEAYFHSKLYLFDLPLGRTAKEKETVAILGSGNFSLPGFLNNVELNAYISDVEKTKKLKDWFDARWEEAKEFDPFLLETIAGEIRRRGKKPIPRPLLDLIIPEPIFEGKFTSLVLKTKNIMEVGIDKVSPSGEEKSLEAVDTTGRHEIKIKTVFKVKGGYFVRGWGKDSLGRKVYTAWRKVDVLPIPEEIFTPRDFYLVTLYKFFEPYIEREIRQMKLFEEVKKGELLKPWQNDAIDTVWATLGRYKGCILADSVGLGKTRIATVVIRRFLEDYPDKKVLIMIPAVLEDILWQRELEKENLWIEGRLHNRISVQHLEAMGRETFDSSIYRDVGLTVVDEAHLFRNPRTGRYRAIEEVISYNRDASLLFVTATPINNTVRDLKSLLQLFLSEAAFAPMGIYHLWEIFRDFYSDNSSERKRATERLDRILNQIAVKRTRGFLQEEYGFREFPQRELEKINYFSTPAMKEILGKLDEAFDHLIFPQYQLKTYKTIKTEDEEEELKESRFVIRFVEFLFVKRFESSIKAFSISMERQIKILQSLLDFLDRFKEEPKKEVLLHYVFFSEHEDSLDILTQKIRQDLEDIAQNRSVYDLKRLKREIEGDLKIMRILHQRSQEAVKSDSKIERLLSTLENELSSKKLLIFTQYIDTARFIYEKLKEKYRSSVGILTGKEKDKEGIIARFAPKANNTKSEFLKTKGEIQILVATDVLSQGLNLQDAYQVISYDLPWNPIVLLQREGRIDRLGQENEKVSVYNFFPLDEIENIIDLIGKLRRKIVEIADTFGKEQKILEAEELINVKEFQATMNRIGDSRLIDDLEERVDSVYQNLMDFLRMRFRKEIKDISVVNRMRDLSENLPKSASMIERGEEGQLFLMEVAGIPQLWLFEKGEILADEQRVIRLLGRVGENTEGLSPRLKMRDIVNEAKQVFREDVKKQRIRGETPGEVIGKIKTRLQSIYLRKSNFRSIVNKMNRLINEVSLSGMEERQLKEILKDAKDEKFIESLKQILENLPKKSEPKVFTEDAEINFWAGLELHRNS